jgi:hypothetical protein
MKVGVVVAADMDGQTKDSRLKESEKSSRYLCAASTASLLASLDPDQFAWIDVQSPGEPFQYRHGSGNFRADRQI